MGRHDDRGAGISDAFQIMSHGIEAVGIQNQGERTAADQLPDQLHGFRMGAKTGTDGQCSFAGQGCGYLFQSSWSQGLNAFRFSQRQGHGLGEFYFQDGVKAGRNAHSHQSGADPHGCLARQSGGPGFSHRTGHDKQVAEISFMAVGMAVREQVAKVGGGGQVNLTDMGLGRRYADIHLPQTAHQFPAGS